MLDSQPIHAAFYPKLSSQLLKARTSAGRSIRECAALLGIPIKKYQMIESGAVVPSLPELEILSYYLGILPQELMGSISQKTEKQIINVEQLQKLMHIRHRILSTSLQLARSQKNLSLKNLSKQTGIPAARIKRYELTSTPIPLDELTAITKALEIPLDSLFDQSGFLSQWQEQTLKIRKMLDLPAELQEFITSPDNLAYLRLAVRLKETGIENLEGLAEGLQQLVSQARQ